MWTLDYEMKLAARRVYQMKKKVIEEYYDEEDEDDVVMQKLFNESKRFENQMRYQKEKIGIAEIYRRAEQHDSKGWKKFNDEIEKRTADILLRAFWIAERWQRFTYESETFEDRYVWFMENWARPEIATAMKAVEQARLKEKW